MKCLMQNYECQTLQIETFSIETLKIVTRKKGTSKEYTEWKITCKKKKRRLELIKNCEKILRVKSIENNIVQWRPPKSRNL